MTSKFKNISKYIVGSALVIGCTISQSFAAYTSLYFNSYLDLMNYEFGVNITQESGNTEVRGEEYYVNDSSKKRTSVYNNKKWREALNPDNTGNGEVYEAKKLDGFKTWVRKPVDRTETGTVSKLVTVPAMKLIKTSGPGADTELNLTQDSNKGTVLTDIVIGTDRGLDEDGKQRYSMVTGLNKMLNAIEHLKGEYENEDDFKNIVMGLAYLMEKDSNHTIVFKGSGTTVSSSDEKAKEDDDEPVADDEIESDGGDIKVVMEKKGNINRLFTVKQESSGYKMQVRMPIKAYTGFKLTGSGSGAVGSIKMNYRDAEDTNGKNIPLENGSDVSQSKVSAEDIEYLKLSDMIRHALIKESAGDTSQGKMNWGERIVYGILDGICSALESMLGLFTLEELVYNSADVNGEKTARSNYYRGIYPAEWTELISIIYTFTGIISVSVLVFAVLRVFGKLTFESMNVGARYSLKEDISKILKTVGVMLLFTLGVGALSEINFLFVKTVYTGLGNSSINFLDVNNLGASGIANVFFRLIMLYVRIYMNITYVVRSLTVALLLALTPAFVVSLSFGKEKIFATYVSELVSNIFMQSFHAIVLLFILKAQSLVLVQGFKSTFTVVILSFSIVPVTKAFKDMVMPSTLGDVGAQMGQKYSQKAIRGVKTATAVAGTAAAVTGGVIVGHQMKKGDQVREKIAGIGKEYSADMGQVLGEANAAGGTKEYMEQAGIKFDENGRLPINFEEQLVQSGMDDEDKNKVRALAAFSEQISNKDMRRMSLSRAGEKLMDMKAVVNSKNASAAAKNVRRMGDKASEYNAEKSLAKMRAGLAQSMNVEDMSKVAGALGNLSNGNNLYTSEEGYIGNREFFDSIGMENMTKGIDTSEPTPLAKMTFNPSQKALSGATSLSQKEFNNLPKDIQGMIKVTEAAGKGAKELAHYKSELTKLENTKGASESSKTEARNRYNNVRKNVIAHTNSVAKQYGIKNVSIQGGAYASSESSNQSSRISISVSSNSYHNMTQLRDGGIRYSPNQGKQ